MQVEVGARSDTGVVRSQNEDCFAVDLSLNLFILCDGMGGQAAGEVASRLGVDIIGEHCRQGAQDPLLDFVGEYQKEFSAQTNRLASSIRLSNQAIHEGAASEPGHIGMGSTVVAAQLYQNILSVAHVGDSRLYLFRDGHLNQLTRDHSLVMEQVRKGLMTAEEAEHSELANVILRALGAEPEVHVDLDEVWVQPGDQILLCSDGLTRMVPDGGIAQILGEAASAQQAAERLVELANEHGGEDNVTVIVVRPREVASPSLWKRLGRFFAGGNRTWPN